MCEGILDTKEGEELFKVKDSACSGEKKKERYDLGTNKLEWKWEDGFETLQE